MELAPHSPLLYSTNYDETKEKRNPLGIGVLFCKNEN